MERLVLLVNHVIAAEPAALERLRPHAARTMQIELTGWPTLLPAVGPFAFRVTPAGLVEWLPEASSPPPDLRVAVDASNPALALTRIVAGERPAITVSGDAAFASDLNWLIDNLRWDVQDDLARIVGDAPARQLAKVGGWRAPRRSEGARSALRDLAGAPAAPARPPPPDRRPDEAHRPARLHLRHGSSLRARRARAVELSPALGAPARARDHDRPPPRRAARRAPAPRPRAARPDLRQVRPGAVDPARPAAGRHRRRARQAAGPRAAVSGRSRARASSSARSAGRSTRCSPASTPRRWRARRSPRCTSRC